MRHLPRRRPPVFFAIVMTFALLGGCQLRPTTLQTYTHPAEMTEWQLNGKLGYRTPNDGGSATFSWQQQPREGNIQFSGPLGFGSAELYWNSGRAELITPKQTYQARSPGELAWHLTGFWLPVSALEYWTRGLAWPGAAGEAQYNEENQLVQLEQLGWSLTFDRYTPIQGVTLPMRIKATQNNNRFTLLIKEWHAGPTP